MHEPRNLLTRNVRDNAVVVTEGGYKRVWWGEIPLGGKVQINGPRCKFRHDFFIDEYPGVSRTYRDKVCRNCTRRIPLN